MPVTELKLSLLPRKPDRRGCEEIEAAWRYLGSARKSVSGLFGAFNILREAEQKEKGEARGAISNDLQDLLRAAIVFTSSGLDACLSRLMRDALPVLVEGNSRAEKKFKDWVRVRLTANGSVPKSMLPAILDRDPRRQLVKLYVTEIASPSLQTTSDLAKIRDALGLEPVQLPDGRIDAMKPFFAARNEIAHELDLTEPTGPGTRARRQRDMEAVRDQCDQVVIMIATITAAVARNLRACNRS